ncbi:MULTISPECIES: hypothetical protein [Streptomycetaceae]|uniref:Secreted protein n=1 Tax=Streptantibioticus cattleyicolor (strain ATCC 35852 / DSM 46488 / JCM 4925 / NBRC 14057 / NRRL 8057) TaxID=1003195 RepID=F8JVW5_STREN|nr:MULTISPECIES: hypothetical protein [Streptomycetaceae]AEW92430.1 hypothetical protein SCATT_00590 [Streptantibioticus cattleyicolor NRRL 8057 = DSM 46488]MYS57238.1 hypothetical protein [Streptomyces sp. SID5468]CCB72795.1 exported protein of unknown function [Streptantibioticus cattleyicolor NRRL 8057 = DSM 46488]
MSGHNTSRARIRKAAASMVAAGVVALGGPTVAAAPASAADHHPKPAPKGPVTAVHGGRLLHPLHVSGCDSFRRSGDGVRWTANCRVDSGRSGSWTHCSDGTDIYGPLVGPGYWIFGGDCSGHGVETNWGVYDG